MSDSLQSYELQHTKASLSITNSWSLLRLIVQRVGDAIQPSHPLSSPSLPAFNVFQHQGLFFSSESALPIMWPKYWSFNFNISLSNEYRGLISFRIDWFDLLADLKSLLQHSSSKASILWCSAFFMVQLSHPYMTTGKTIPLTRWIFVGKVMSLLCNMLSRFVITFLPRSKHLLVSWLKSPSAVILEPRKIVMQQLPLGPQNLVLLLQEPHLESSQPIVSGKRPGNFFPGQ